jgi:hypothetical protein
MTCFTPCYHDILYRLEFNGERSTAVERSPFEVDLLYQGVAKIDQNVLVDAFEPDRVRGQGMAHPPSQVADIDVSLQPDPAQLGSCAVVPDLRVWIESLRAGPP